jgi:hypothetical protein
VHVRYRDADHGHGQRGQVPGRVVGELGPISESAKTNSLHGRSFYRMVGSIKARKFPKVYQACRRTRVQA